MVLIQKITLNMIGRISSFCRRRWHRLALLACIFAFTLVVTLSFQGNNNHERPSREIYRSIDLKTFDEDVLRLSTGIYINRIYNIDRASGTFSANGWLWLSWDKPDDDDWHKGEINIDVIKFINEIPNARKQERLINEPQEEYEGRMWQGMRFSSTFLMNNQNYSKFPFENIELPIEVGTDKYTTNSVVYAPNLKDSLVSDRLSLSGFEFRGLQARNLSHSITSWFGHSIDPSWVKNNQDRAYPHLEWVMQFRRISSSSIARLFTPVFAAMVVLMFSLLVSLKHAVPKITIPTSVLLVLAVLQERTQRLLPPDLTYLTYMDKIYMFCYVLTLISLVSSLYCINRLHSGSVDNHHRMIMSLGDGQRLLVGLMSLSILTIPLILWILHPG